MKNLDWFIVINVYGEYLIFSDIIQIISNRNNNKK
jgi:hypothetical protein